MVTKTLLQKKTLTYCRKKETFLHTIKYPKLSLQKYNVNYREKNTFIDKK